MIRSAKNIAAILVIVLLATVSILSGCSSFSTEQKSDSGSTKQVSKKPTEVDVSAAASLKDAFKKLAPGFEKENNAKLVFNFASSGDLQTQIEQGAPADVFVSAGKKQVDALADKKLIDTKRRVDLLGNDLVVVVPASNTLDIQNLESLGSLADIKNIAIGTPSDVPCGKYAQEALEKAGVWAALQPKFVQGKDVRQVLSYVESGNADLGFVYVSDAKTSKNVKVAYSVPSSYHKPIVYPVAVLKGAKQPKLGATFIDYLKSSAASKVFVKMGFKTLTK